MRRKSTLKRHSAEGIVCVYFLVLKAPSLPTKVQYLSGYFYGKLNTVQYIPSVMTTLILTRQSPNKAHVRFRSLTSFAAPPLPPQSLDQSTTTADTNRSIIRLLAARLFRGALPSLSPIMEDRIQFDINEALKYYLSDPASVPTPDADPELLDCETDPDNLSSTLIDHVLNTIVDGVAESPEGLARSSHFDSLQFLLKCVLASNPFLDALARMYRILNN